MSWQKRLKESWKKFWFLLWKDDSLKGWVFSLLFIFIFIKFIFFPILSLATGTSLPLAIVESCSMYHEGNFFSNYNEWWQGHEQKYSSYEITKELFGDFIFRKGFNKGDILFIVGAKPEELERGDVIIFTGGMKHPVIHRIIDITEESGEDFFSTVGDNYNGQLSFEKKITSKQIVGKAVFKIAPYVGWGKLIFFEYNRKSSERGFCREN